MIEDSTLKEKQKRTYIIWKDGAFIESDRPGVFAIITSQKIFGRLTCQSGKRALKKNRIFTHTWKDAISWGARPCKKCKPSPDDWYNLCLLCKTYILGKTPGETFCRCGKLRVRSSRHGEDIHCDDPENIILVGPY